MRKTLGSIDGKMQGALDWLRDPTAMQVLITFVIIVIIITISIIYNACKNLKFVQ